MKEIEYLKKIDIKRLCDEINSEYPDIANKIAMAFKELFSEIKSFNQTYYNEQIESLSKYTSNNDTMNSKSDTISATNITKDFTNNVPVSQNDNNLEHGHSLNEEFNGTKISQIKIRSHVINCSHWNDALVKVCEYLYNVHSRPIISLINKPINNKSNKRSKRQRFTYDITSLTAGKLIPGTNIYVETNDNANGIVACIRELLDIYNIPINQCTIYLKDDWKFPELPENADELKIGELAQQYFDDMFSMPVPTEIIHNMLDKQWSHENLGITFPLIVETSNLAPEKSRRYYKKKRIVNGVEYYLCSQWYKHDRPRLYKWIFANTGVELTDTTSHTEIISDDSKFDKDVHFGGMTIPAFVLVKILEKMNDSNKKNKSFCANIKELRVKSCITQNTKYKKAPQNVVNNVRKYLFDNNIIKYKQGNKNKYYVISDQQRFDMLIENPYSIEDLEFTNKNNDNNVYLYVLEKRHKRCPECNGLLIGDTCEYIKKYDQNNQMINEHKKAQIKCCPICNKQFITTTTYNTLRKNGNIENNSNIVCLSDYVKK